MKKLLLLVIVASFSAGSFAKSSDYRIDDTKVEAALEEVNLAQNVLDIQDLTNSSVEFNASLYAERLQGSREPLVALLLDFFLGGLAIHRVYLGGSPGLIAGYFFTCGGIFGILPLVDLILIAVNFDDISPYVDNSRFFMWKPK